MRNIALFFSLASLPLLVACGGQTIAASSSDGGADSEPSTPPACEGPRYSCNSVCVDLLTDPNNCGACKSVCIAGGACVNGGCLTTQPTPVTNPGVPSNPGGPAPTGSADVTVAIHTFYLGDSDRNGVQSATAWAQLGLNIDGKTTTAASTDVCTLYAGAARISQVDGSDGIDNSFGENIIPLLLTVAGESYATEINQSVVNGRIGTMMFGLGNLGAAANAYPLVGSAFTADATATAPTWDGTDVWPIDSSSVSGSSPPSALAQFPQSYVNGRVWVSGPVSQTQVVLLPFLFPPAAVPVRVPQLVMTVAGDNSAATNGTFAGVVNTEDFVDSIMAVAGRISTSLCSGSAFQSIAQQIDEGSDILSDGSNSAGQACDAISIGIGFDATAAQVGAVVTPVPPADPCSQ